MLISTNIKYLRNKKRWTQMDLAQQLGKTSAAISDYEKGKATPPLEVALQLCELFDVTLDQLASRNIQTEDILSQEGVRSVREPDLRGYYSELKQQLEDKIKSLERINQLQEQRLSDLEWMIRKHAPELAREIGLLDGGE